MKKVKRIDMAIHVQELCAANYISVAYQPLSQKHPKYWARRDVRKIMIRPTKNTGYYVSALHEIGHIVGKFQDRSQLTRELWAWVWARQNAIVWTDTADRVMARAMESYGWQDKHKARWNQIFGEQQ